jgi:hypothetical protein
MVYIGLQIKQYIITQKYNGVKFIIRYFWYTAKKNIVLDIIFNRNNCNSLNFVLI